MPQLRKVFYLLIFLINAGLSVHAQVPAPPPTPQGGFADPGVPRRQWTLGIHGGFIGYSPTETVQISGHDHFSRTANFSTNGTAGFYQWVGNDGKRHISFSANTSIGISAGTILANKKGTVFHTIEGVFEQNKAFYTFTPPFYFTFQGDTFGGWGMMDKYLNYGLAYQVCFGAKLFRNSVEEHRIYVRTTFSQSFYHRNFGDRIVQGRYEDWTENGTGMKATTVQASKSSYMLSFEVGVRTFSPEWDRSFDYGFAAHIPFNNSYTDQYEFVQNNTSVGVSQTTYTGATFLLNLRYTFNFSPKEHERDTAIPPPDIYVSTDTTREIDVQESFEVHHKWVRVRVWDRNEVDGDVVSLFMNDELIKKDLKLKRRKKTFRVKLKPGSNILVMYAENLGDIPPNTAALQIKDGKKKRNVNLVSDNGKSGAVELIYVPK